MVRAMTKTRERQESERAAELRQQHDRLLGEAMRQPGVAEVIEVYGRLAPYAPRPATFQPKTRYGTGGNG